MDSALKDAIYDKQASAHSKTAIVFWFITGLIWVVIGPTDANFSWIGAILFFFPGIFIASFASMPLFLVRNKFAVNVIEKDQDPPMNFIFILNILDIVMWIAAPIIYIELVERLF